MAIMMKLLRNCVSTNENGPRNAGRFHWCCAQCKVGLSLSKSALTSSGVKR